MKLLFSGGGTLGPVTPLITIVEEIKKTHPNDEIFWVSTRGGIENDILSSLNIKIYSIDAAKLRRYISIKNFLDIFKFLKSFYSSYKIIKKERPDIIISAGGYVSVPLVIVGKLFFRKKVLIHQQDIEIGLANKIMSYFADVITVSFENQLNSFLNKNTFYTGNPCRFNEDEIGKLNKEEILSKYELKSDKPIVLVLGGSSGASTLNDTVLSFKDSIFEKCQIVHVTGVNKNVEAKKPNYKQFQFLKENLIEFMYISDIVISRAGLATFSELSSMHKCVIMVPLLGHQEINARYFYEKDAIEIASLENLELKLEELLNNKDKRVELQKNIASIMPRGSATKISEKIYGLKKIQ